MLKLSFAQLPYALLRDRKLTPTDKMVAGLLMQWMGTRASGRVFNAIIAEGANIEVRSVSRSLKRMEKWFRCELVPDDRFQRKITALWRLDGFKVPDSVPPDPGRRKADTLTLESSPPDPTVIPPMPTGSPKEQGVKNKKKEEGRSVPSLHETTLSSEGSRASGFTVPGIPKLQQMLRGITEDGISPAARNKRVTACAKWLASNLVDGQSQANYCKVLQRVLRGELTADHVIEAYTDTYSRGMGRLVGNWGAYFFGAINNIRSDLAYEEVEADWRANLP